MQRFKTLLLREWMQHRIGWLAMMLVPFGLILLGVSFGTVHSGVAGTDVGITVDGQRMPMKEGLLPLTLAALGGTAAITLMLVWMGNLIQAPGLARRDQQDRSIEFWLSLPASHVQSLGATLLMHLLLVPAVALVAGLLGGVLIALVAMLRVDGPATWLAAPWGLVLPAVMAGVLRAVFGLLLATLWISPLVLGTMAASAWLKRWGLPAVIGGLTLGHVLLKNTYGIPFIADTIGGWLESARLAMVGASMRNGTPGMGSFGEFERFVRDFPRWALDDAAAAVVNLASPSLVLGLAIAAGSFALLILKRQRGAA